MLVSGVHRVAPTVNALLLDFERLSALLCRQPVRAQHHRPSEADVRLSEDGTTAAMSGALRDRQGVVLTLGEAPDVCAAFTVEAGDLPADFDASWRREAG